MTDKYIVVWEEEGELRRRVYDWNQLSQAIADYDILLKTRRKPEILETRLLGLAARELTEDTINFHRKGDKNA